MDSVPQSVSCPWYSPISHCPNLPHLVHVPGLGALTARSLTGADLEVLGWETDWALDAQFLALGTLDQLLADLLERGDLAGSEGDADLVDLWRIELRGLLWVLERHGAWLFVRVGGEVLEVSIRLRRY